MLKEKIQELRSEITKRQTAINTKIKEAHQRAEEDKLEEAKTIKDEITSLKAEIETMTEKLKELEELAGMEAEEITEGAREGKTGEERSFPLGTPQVRLDKGIEEQRRSFETFLRTRGEVRDGLTTEGAAAIIPIEVITTPQKTPEDIVDLVEFVNKVNVTAASGSYPVLENTETELVSVAELEKNPELANPKFNKIDWKVETYRGQLAISQESIDDSGVDLTALVADHLQQVKRNTRNTKIAGVLKTFTAKTVTGTDDIKKILNVDLKQAYARNVLSTSSAFQFLDTLKDKNGQYILQSNISSPSGKTLFGSQIKVVDDTLLGKKAGDMNMFIGDLKRAAFFANRVDVVAKWVENAVYGQVLSLAIRFDVKQADKNAGFYVTIKPPVETGATE